MKMYQIRDQCDENLCCVVANTAKEAKRIAMGHESTDYNDWIEVKANWLKGANTEGFKKGVFEDCIEAVRRGIFDTDCSVPDGCSDHEECCKIMRERY